MQIKTYANDTLTKHYKDPLVPPKVQFFAFGARIFQPYLVIFQTNSPMIPFMFKELEKIFNQLLRLVVRKEVIDQAGRILKKIKKE